MNPNPGAAGRPELRGEGPVKTTNPLAIAGILILLLVAAVSLGCGQGDQVEASDDTRGETEVAQADGETDSDGGKDDKGKKNGEGDDASESGEDDEGKEIESNALLDFHRFWSA